MRFWNISQFLLLSFWIPGMADLFLKNCKQWQQEFFAFPTYNCSISENSTIRFPMRPNSLTYVIWRANSSSADVPFLLFSNGTQLIFSGKFKSCVFSDGYLSLGNLKEGQQGIYEVTEKHAIKARIYVSILPGQQRKRNPADSAASTLSTSYFLVLGCVLLMVGVF